MEDYYLIQIWHVIGAEENQNLTAKEQQGKILSILSQFRNEVESGSERKTKIALKKQIEEIFKESK